MEFPREICEEGIRPVSLVVEVALLGIVTPGLIVVLVGVKEYPGAKENVREEEDYHQDEDAYHKQ
jgi:hypothetical protein